MFLKPVIINTPLPPQGYNTSSLYPNHYSILTFNIKTYKSSILYQKKTHECS